MEKIFALLFVSAQCSFAQSISNPSFEGRAGYSLAPPEWYPCNAYSTPDTQPGAWNVTTVASDGDTYISLVTRGLNGDEKNDTKEAIYTTFTSPFTIGNTYQISLDLAFAPNFNDYWYYPDWRPVKLKIYFTNNNCEKTTLAWESPVISGAQWVTHSFFYTATPDLTYFLMEANCAKDVPYNGNILVDNIVIGRPHTSTEHALILSKGCKLGVPNVFTPNSDDINDQLTIQHQSNVDIYHLNVYDRWGKLVFESSQIDNAWDGRTRSGDIAPAGVYYWTIGCFCIDGNSIREEDLKGTVALLN
jgi:gliding motility-associated-like protein